MATEPTGTGTNWDDIVREGGDELVNALTPRMNRYMNFSADR